MSSFIRFCCVCLLAVCLLFSNQAVHAAESGTVVLVELSGEIDLGQAALVSRALDLARSKQAKAFILQMDTFGGLVDAATRIRDMVIDSELPTVCYVKNRAWSAGALIALAHRQIAVAPGGSLGAAEPIPTTEKTIAAVKAEFAATAQRTGRDPRIAEAMVDKTLGYKEYAKPGQILALTDYQAVEVGYAEFVAQDREQLLEKLNLSGSKLEVVSKSWKEDLTGWLESPAVKSTLLTFLILAIITEIKTAGMGVGLAIAAVCALALFGSSLITGLSGWLEPLLFLAGVALITMEMLTPGFGVFGISGIIAMVVSFFLILGGGTQAIVWLAGSIFAAVVLFALLLRNLPAGKLWSGLVLKNTSSKQAGFSAGPDYERYLGMEGLAVTRLCPGGAAQINGEKLDVLTFGEFVEKGCRVVVVKVEGSKLFVKPLD